jgi:hypothetical protein
MNFRFADARNEYQVNRQKMVGIPFRENQGSPGGGLD